MAGPFKPTLTMLRPAIRMKPFSTLMPDTFFPYASSHYTVMGGKVMNIHRTVREEEFIPVADIKIGAARKSLDFSDSP